MKIQHVDSLQKDTGPRLRSGSLVVVLILALMGVAGAGAAFGQAVKISKLNVSAATALYGNSLNASNQVVGSYGVTGGITKGFEYLGGNMYKTIVFPRSANFTRANGINDSGEIVGDFFGSDNFFHGYTDVAGVLTQFDLPGGKGKFSTSTFGISNDGDTVGAAGGGTLGSTNEGWVIIGGTLTTFHGSGTHNTFVYAINASDEFVGQYFDSSSISHAFSGVVTGGVAVLTPISYPGAVQTSCNSINDSGEIAGYYIDSGGVTHGFTDVGGVFTTSSLPAIYGINNTGSTVGYYVGPMAIEYGYLAVPQTFAPTNIKVRGAVSTSTFGVNNAGTLVGQYTTATNKFHGFMQVGTTVTNIDNPSAGVGGTYCNGVNASNHVVGYYQDSGTTYHSFFYSGGTFTNDLVPGATQSLAYNINDAGDIAGQFNDVSNAQHGFLLKGGVGGTLTQLDVPGATATVAWGVNAADTVTVTFTDSAGYTEAATYNSTTQTYTTIDLPGAAFMSAHSINKSGAVVYSWFDLSGGYHGGLFSGGSYYLLDDPGGNGTRADGINDSGIIVGRYNPTGSTDFDGFKGVK
jgi:hypothetical protein